MRRTILTTMAITCVLVSTTTALAVDFEKKLPHDYACVVKAFSSGGDVYLKCKEVKGILKTSVDLPTMTSMMGFKSTSEQVKLAKKIARSKVVWGILDFSFSTQLHVLVTFNDDKTLISDAVAYMQPEFDERISRKSKLDL